MDAQSRLESVGGIAALVHALALASADGHEEATPPSEALMESSFLAGRDGLDAAGGWGGALRECSFRPGRGGLDATVWWRGALMPMREVAGDALMIARPYARELDGEDALEEIDRMLRQGGGADRMREAHAAGGMEGVLARLAEETMGGRGSYSTQTTSPSRTQL